MAPLGPTTTGLKFVNITVPNEARSAHFSLAVRSHVAKNRKTARQPAGPGNSISGPSILSLRSPHESDDSSQGAWHELAIERLRLGSAYDPFSTLPLPVTLTVQRALEHAFFMVRHLDAGFRGWIRKGMQDPAVFSTMMLCVAQNIYQMRSGSCISQEGLMSQRSLVLRTTNNVLADGLRNISDDAIFIVITLSEHEVFRRDGHAYCCHAAGLRRIMALRSLAGQMPSPLLSRTAQWVISLFDVLSQVASSTSALTSVKDKQQQVMSLLQCLQGTLFIIQVCMKTRFSDLYNIITTFMAIELALQEFSTGYIDSASQVNLENRRLEIQHLIDEGAELILPRTRENNYDDFADEEDACVETVRLALKGIMYQIEAMIDGSLPKEGEKFSKQATLWMEKPFFASLNCFPFWCVWQLGKEAFACDSDAFALQSAALPSIKEDPAERARILNVLAQRRYRRRKRARQLLKDG